MEVVTVLHYTSYSNIPLLILVILSVSIQSVSGYVPCTNGDAIRLRGGSATSGRVEICNNDMWGTVCDASWTSLEARVVCIQLGLPSSGKALRIETRLTIVVRKTSLSE